MQKHIVQALFDMAGFKVSGCYELPNRYWPDNEHYAQIRRENPWWLVLTEYGPIVICGRKRVISIDWQDTLIELEDNAITEENTTKGYNYILAWSYPKALEYLTILRTKLREAKQDGTTV